MLDLGELGHHVLEGRRDFDSHDIGAGGHHLADAQGLEGLGLIDDVDLNGRLRLGEQGRRGRVALAAHGFFPSAQDRAHAPAHALGRRLGHAPDRI